MNPDVKTRWLAALRSGDYAQGHDRLTTRTSDGSFEHCCLGVLCELAVADGVVQRYPDDACATYGTPEDGTEEAYLPSAVRRWAGLPRDPSVSDGAGGETSLATLNDGADDHEAYDFGELADLIEEQL